MENAGVDSKGGKCRSGKCGSRQQRWKMQEWKMQEQTAKAENAGVITYGKPSEDHTLDEIYLIFCKNVAQNIH